MVDPRTLTPLVLVRVQVPQPSLSFANPKIFDLSRFGKTVIFRYRQSPIGQEDILPLGGTSHRVLRWWSYDL